VHHMARPRPYRDRAALGPLAQDLPPRLLRSSGQRRSARPHGSDPYHIEQFVADITASLGLELDRFALPGHGSARHRRLRFASPTQTPYPPNPGLLSHELSFR
jgi:hypothetical protein